LIYLAVDTQASINRAAEITLSSIERAKRILDQNDPSKLKSGARRTISVRQSDLASPPIIWRGSTPPEAPECNCSAVL